MKKLLFFTLFIGMGISEAKIEPKRAKKPTFGQVYGGFKVALGAGLAFYGLKSLSNSYSNGHVSDMISTNFPDILDLFFGSHLIYFGTLDILKQRSKSYCFFAQKTICDIVAASYAIKFSKKSLRYCKSLILSVNR